MRFWAVVVALMAGVMAGPSVAQTKPGLRFMQIESYSDDWNGNNFPRLVRDRLKLLFDVRDTDEGTYRWGVHMSARTSGTNQVLYYVAVLENCGSSTGQWCYVSGTSGTCNVATNCEDVLHNWIAQRIQQRS